MFNNKLKIGLGVVGGISAGLASLFVAKKAIEKKRNENLIWAKDVLGNEYNLDEESIIPDFEGDAYVVIEVISYADGESEDLETFRGRALFDSNDKLIAYVTDVKDGFLIGKII